MQIKKAEVENFRKLKNVTIDLDDSVTLIVGRNNSGKTSLSEVFNKFLGPIIPDLRLMIFLSRFYPIIVMH